MVELYVTIIGWLLNIAVSYLFIRYDRQRLGKEQLARAWNGATWACAVFFFGPLSFPAHFWVTRRTWIALLEGVMWSVVVLGGEYLIGLGLDQVTGTS